MMSKPKEWRLRAASEGKGPLLQRDYWAVIRDCRGGPHDVVRRVVEQFGSFAPSELVQFARPSARQGALRLGDEIAVRIRGTRETAVRVVHRDANSITLATVAGHPEAGRITFGSYRNDAGDVVFHIRSRARSGSRAKLTAFLAAGEAMQTNTWTDFIANLANSVGGGVAGAIHAETTEADEEDQDRPGSIDHPTFIARGD